MGVWGHEPWDNDEAADWFGELFRQAPLIQVIESTLQLEPCEHAERIRAAAYVVAVFGRPYVWPASTRVAYLEMARDALRRTLAAELYADSPAMKDRIELEIERLESRLREDTT
jgi:hypothetical protein